MSSTITAPRTAAPRPARSASRPGRAQPQVHRVTSARAPRRPVRLTRRGRLLLLLVLVALAFSLASLGRVAGWAAGPAGGPGASSQGPIADQWVVQPGESLWQVAVAVAPDTDPRDTVARIVELNGLDSATVTAGQALLVPTTPR